MSGGTSSKSPTDRREWRQRPTAERIAYANKLLVLHPRFREAVALLERCHQSSKQAGEPICGAILGSSGVGKTSVVDHYRRLHPPRETDTANCQPVLTGTLQPVWKKGTGLACSVCVIKIVKWQVDTVRFYSRPTPTSLPRE